MTPQSKTRRRFIKASLAVPLLSSQPWSIAIANTLAENHFSVPENIYDELVRIYGDQAGSIISMDSLTLKAPDIAENGAVVPITISGDKGLVSSLVIFVTNNPHPLVSRCNLHEGADLAVSFRIKMQKTSDIFLVAQTQYGLVGSSKTVKISIGCGGA